MNYAWYDLVGNVGVALIILAYLAVQVEWMSSQGLLYSCVNLAGASLILVSLHYTFNLSSFVIEIFWIGISIVGIVRFAIRKKTAPRA